MLVNSGQEIIACICHGHMIQAAANLLEGRKCTAFPPLKLVLIAAGAFWFEHYVNNCSGW